MKTSPRLAALAAAATVAAGCGTSHKLRTIRHFTPRAEVSLPVSSPTPEIDIMDVKDSSITVTDEQGRELILMNAAYDEQSGEMVATEELSAAYVVARFRNVAERHGEVDLEFLIVVSDTLQDPHWQLRFCPTMYIQGDTIPLDSVYITGEDFRRSQERGYRLYGRYLNSLSRDSLHFVDKGQMEAILRRSTYGITEQEARTHYTRGLLVRLNASRLKSDGRMRRKYLHNPLDPESVRKDSVANGNSRFVYTYVQTISTRPQLRKAEIVLEGGIYDDQKCIYRIPKCEPISFYISSISSFADLSVHYRQVVVERAVLESQKCDIAFRAGQAEIDPHLGRNRAELERIKTDLGALLSNDDLVLDSVVVRASCSPEGSWELNRRLARKRTEQACTFVRGVLAESAGDSAFSVDENGNITTSEPKPLPPVVSRGIAENWQLLDSLVMTDRSLSARERASYRRIARIGGPDEREARLRSERYYRYLRSKHYPALRFVSVEEHLHRKDMVKDTIHTTVVDTLYMEGLKYLEDRDYEKALAILGPYQDYNAAVAYLSLDYNASAEQILRRLPRTARNLYMLAIISSRRGAARDAVQLFMDACALEPSYRYRGNLDPEIASLIKAYGLDGLESQY